MFYSHTFLARKGPLGTVWCAAHLQHKLRKSHYIATNIPSTVERIIDSEVPIALRMSGHLLLGVVRIYSKQVDYFQEDCNVVLITLNRVYSAVTVNLPDDANRAPANSITLPQNFDLDAMELDDYFKDGFEDTHLKSHEEITLTEQVPTGRDPYIVISFDEHELRSSSSTQNISGAGPIPMEEDVQSPVQAGDPTQHNEFGDNVRSIGESTPPPSLEIMRDARHGFHFNSSPVLPDRAEPDPFLEEQINKDKEAATPVRDEVELPDARFSSSHRHQEQNSFEPSNSPIFSAPQSPQMELQPTPPIAVAHKSSQMELQAIPPIAEPNAKNKRRRQPFNNITVLSNKDMKKALNDTSGLRRRKRNCPSSSLDIWKLSKRLKKDSVFHEPFITGSSADLQDMHNKDFISSNPHLVTSTTENAQGTGTAQPPLSGDNDSTEIEVLRNTEQAFPDRNMPSFSAVMPSSSGRSYFTPEKSNSGVQFEQFETTERNEIENTTNIGASTATFDSDMGTSDTFHYREDLNMEHTALSDIPETVASAGDLGFLEHDDHSPAGSQGTAGFGFPSMNLGTPELHALSSRTRAVAQYLRKQCPVTPISGKTEETSGDLNLNKILEGKSRKICARMFYETLVLKNYDLIDVQQESPYDDVTLKVTPKLSKGELS